MRLEPVAPGSGLWAWSLLNSTSYSVKFCGLAADWSGVLSCSSRHSIGMFFSATGESSLRIHFDIKATPGVCHSVVAQNSFFYSFILNTSLY